MCSGTLPTIMLVPIANHAITRKLEIVNRTEGVNSAVRCSQIKIPTKHRENSSKVSDLLRCTHNYGRSFDLVHEAHTVPLRTHSLPSIGCITPSSLCDVARPWGRLPLQPRDLCGVPRPSFNTLLSRCVYNTRITSRSSRSTMCFEVNFLRLPISAPRPQEK